MRIGIFNPKFYYLIWKEPLRDWKLSTNCAFLRKNGAATSDLGDLLRNEGLRRVAEQLERMVLPSIRMSSVARRKSELAVGTSKLGGLPDLPEGMAWTTWRNVPLAFIAQINLSEIHAFDLTGLLLASGLLYFFYDADHVPVEYDPTLRGGWRVLYENVDYSRFQRVPVPSALLEKKPTWLPQGQQYAECALRFSLEVTLPSIDSISIESLHFSSEEQDAYWSILDVLEQRIPGPLHRLLGHPDALQGDMQVESQLVSHGFYLGNGWPEERERAEQLLPGAQDWQLLLQLDND